jgi:hypothetical protein
VYRPEAIKTKEAASMNIAPIVLQSNLIDGLKCVATFGDTELIIEGSHFTVSAPRDAKSLKVNGNKIGVTLSVSYDKAWRFEISTGDSQRFKELFDEWKINRPDGVGVGMPGRSVPGIIVSSSDDD